MADFACAYCGKSFWSNSSKAKYCSRRCYERGKSKDPARFWKHVAAPNKRGCRLWTGKQRGNAARRSMYGEFAYKGRHVQAHRHAWFLAHGPVPRGKLVCHECDEKLCVNAEHLFLGTHQDNTDDMLGKGRHWVFRGSRQPNAKLSEHEVIEIRRTYAAGGASMSQLATRFHTSIVNVHRIIHRTRWRHVPPS